MNEPANRPTEVPGVLLAHGGYRHLRSYKVTEAVYDATVVFCRRFQAQDRRMTDQMVQAARSGVRNISEGSGLAATSRKTGRPAPAAASPCCCARPAPARESAGSSGDAPPTRLAKALCRAPLHRNGAFSRSNSKPSRCRIVASTLGTYICVSAGRCVEIPS